MPADFVKIELKQEGIAEQLRQCPNLAFESRLTKNKNLVWEARHKNMLFEIFEPSMKVEVSGSLHYLFNDGLHNWNDFNRLDLFDMVIEFCNMFGIEPQKAVLHGFEFGVNIKVPFEPSYFIERVLAYKSGKIEPLTDKAIYNKSNHQRQFLENNETHILRFEVKITRMARVRGIAELKTLHDLLKPKILQKLGRMLLSEFSELVVSAPMDTERMTARERATFEQMNCRQFWETLTDKEKRRQSKTTFRRLTNKYGNGLHKEISMLVSQKWNELLEWQKVEEKQKHPTFLQGVTLLKTSNKYDVSELPENQNTPLFYHLNINNDNTHTRNNELKSGEFSNDEPLKKKENLLLKKGGNFVAKPKKIAKCANCRRVLESSSQKYCNERCKVKKDKRNDRSNPNHAMKNQAVKIIMHPVLFEQGEFIKIEPNKLVWLQQHGVTI
jgi:hypothetical protein